MGEYPPVKADNLAAAVKDASLGDLEWADYLSPGDVLRIMVCLQIVDDESYPDDRRIGAGKVIELLRSAAIARKENHAPVHAHVNAAA